MHFSGNQLGMIPAFISILIVLVAGTAAANLNAYIQDLNTSAQGDFRDYRAQVQARFGIGDAELDLIYRTVNGHGEVAVLLWLRERCGLPLDAVLGRYREHKGEGWGAIAKSLGIKPGSDAFHRLKSGDLGWYPYGEGRGKGKGPRKRKGKPKDGENYYRY